MILSPLTGAWPRSAGVQSNARDPDKRSEAIVSTLGTDAGDSRRPRDVDVQPFLATECLCRDVEGGSRSSTTFIMTRARSPSPLLRHYRTVPGDGSVKRFNVPIAYRRARATDVADERDRRDVAKIPGREGG